MVQTSLAAPGASHADREPKTLLNPVATRSALLQSGSGKFAIETAKDIPVFPGAAIGHHEAQRPSTTERFGGAAHHIPLSFQDAPEPSTTGSTAEDGSTGSVTAWDPFVGPPVAWRIGGT